RYSHNHIQVMFHEKNCGAEAISNLANEIHKLLDFAMAQASCRLIEHQKLRPTGQRAPEFDEFFCSKWQGVHNYIRYCFEAEHMKLPTRFLQRLSLFFADGRQSESVLKVSGFRAGKPPHRDVLQNREIREQSQVLK